MKSNRYLLVVLSMFLISLVFIASASASDVNETRDVLSIDESANLENSLLSVDNNVKSNELSNDTLKVSNDEVLTAGSYWYVNSSKTSSGDGKSEDSAFKTLNEALNKANNDDTIMIASGEYKGTGNIGLTFARNINLIKYGDGEAIFNGEKKSQIWDVEGEKGANIVGLTFVNGKKDDYGGAIYFNKAGKIVNCTFRDNNAKYGGAVYGVGDIIINNCQFTKNVASNGGAVYTGFYGGRITNCEFNMNRASRGGAIHFEERGYVDRSNFIGNNASAKGGAIYVGVSCSVKDCNLEHNTATGSFSYGGAIFFNSYSANNKLSNCNFTDNLGKNIGGAVYFESAGNVEYCNFINNVASYRGGAVYFNSSTKTGFITYSKFINNSARNSGGAIEFDNPGSIENSIFDSNNVIYGDGGAVHFEKKGFVEYSNFTSNSVYDTSYGNGGAIYFKEEAIVYSSNFINNRINGSKSSYSCGGAFYCKSASVHICNFINNTATTNGGAIAFPYTMGSSADSIIIADSNFIDNVAGTDGGAIDIEYGKIRDCLFEDNIARGNGGAIRFKGGVKGGVNITNCNFNDNIAEANGGAIYSAMANGNVSNCNFVSNSAMYGGAFHSSGGDIFMSNNTMINCAGLKDNAPIYISAPNINSKTNLIIYNDSVIKLGDEITINAELTDDNGNYISGGKINFMANDYYIDSGEVINGSVNVVFIPEYVGKYIISGNHDLSEDLVVKTATVEVISSNIIIAPDVTKYYGGSERFVVSVKDKDNNPVADVEVKIHINGQTYTKTTDNNGETSIGINLNSGVYNVTTECDDTKVYSTVTVKDTVIAKDVTKIFRNGTQYQGTFVDSKGNLIRNTDIRININGVYYTRTTDSNGMAQMNINLPPGTYILTATNPLSSEQHTTTVTVLPNIVENYDLTKYYKNASQYSLRLLDDKGNPVGAGVSIQLNINGVLYTRTSDANGYVKMNINLPPGTYIVTAEYKGLRASNTIKVLTVLEAKDLVMKYRDGSQFKAKVLDGQGRPYKGQTVTFNINGVFYTRTTGDDGVAGLTINLPAGEYTITSTFNGLNVANKVSIAPDYLYYTIKGNPLDYNYYMNEYNRFTFDWYYSPQWSGMIRTIYDIYGNQGLEVRDQDVHAGVKYHCYEASTGKEIALNSAGEVIIWSYGRGYTEEYIRYDYNNNIIERGKWVYG